MSYKKEWKIDLFLKSNEVMETLNLLDLKNFSNLGKIKEKELWKSKKDIFKSFIHSVV